MSAQVHDANLNLLLPDIRPGPENSKKDGIFFSNIQNTFSGILNYLDDNYIQGCAEHEEEKLRAACPFLLQDGERVVFAFLGAGGSGRDSSFLTDRRILVRDVTGITGSSVKYTSTPFSAIKAYAISTVGGGLDHDSELQVLFR